MSTKLYSAFRSNLFTANNIRIALFVLTLVLLVLGAGAPSDGGGLGGFAPSFGGDFQAGAAWVVLLTAVLAGLLITILRARLTGRRLRPVQLKHSWLVFAAVLPQVIVFQISAVGRLVPDLLASAVLVGSQAMLLVFAAANIAKPGIWALGIGLAANFLAIVSNGGWMPIGPDTVHRILTALPDDAPLAGRRLGLTKDWIIENDAMKFSWLADRFTLPDWISYKVAFSIGDVFIAIGAVLLLWSLSNSEIRS